MKKSNRITSAELISEMHSLIKSSIDGEIKEKYNSYYTSLDIKSTKEGNKKFLFFTISGVGKDRLEIDIKDDLKLEECKNGIEVPTLYIAEVKFQKVKFKECFEQDKKTEEDKEYTISMGQAGKLMFDDCRSDIKLKIESIFMSEEDDDILVEISKDVKRTENHIDTAGGSVNRKDLTDVKRQDFVGVKFIKCNFDKEVEIDYKVSDGIYGKFLGEGCIFRNLVISRTGDNKNIARDFFMEFRKNELIEKLDITYTGSHQSGKEGRYQLKLIQENSIKTIIFQGRCPDVIAWGLNEKIGEILGTDYAKKFNEEELKTKINQNKQELMVFRKQAADKGDRLHQAIISRHISKCDEQLISLEGWRNFGQENLTMLAGRLLSNHGSSWLRPLLWVIVSNMCLSLLIYIMIMAGNMYIITGILGFFIAFICMIRVILARKSKFGQLFYESISGIVRGILARKLEDTLIIVFIFLLCTELLFSLICSNNTVTLLSITADLFNPLTTTSDLVSDQIISTNCYAFVGLILAASKALYAACVYEFVRAARQFTYR